MWRQNKLLIIIALTVGAGYGSHMLYRYMKIRGDSSRRAAVVVRPRLDEDEVAEIGYVYESGTKFSSEMTTKSILYGSSKSLGLVRGIPARMRMDLPISGRAMM